MAGDRSWINMVFAKWTNKILNKVIKIYNLIEREENIILFPKEECPLIPKYQLSNGQGLVILKIYLKLKIIVLYLKENQQCQCPGQLPCIAWAEIVAGS